MSNETAVKIRALRDTAKKHRRQGHPELADTLEERARRLEMEIAEARNG